MRPSHINEYIYPFRIVAEATFFIMINKRVICSEPLEGKVKNLGSRKCSGRALIGRTRGACVLTQAEEGVGSNRTHLMSYVH